MKELICPNCGSKLPEDSAFCQYCGNRIAATNVSNYETETKIKSKKSRKGLVITVVVASLVVISALYAVLAIPFIKYQNACAEFEEGEYSAAVEMFEDLDGYKDSEDKIKEAKFQYVQEHKNNDDLITYAYLKDLKEQDYRNSAAIYKILYDWKVTVFAVNSSEYNTVSNYNTLSRSSPIYFHLILTGGEPNASVRINVKAQHPDGYIEENAFMYKWESGRKGWYGWPEGLYDNPDYGETGMLKCSFYDENGNLIGYDFVMIDD